MTTRTTTPSTSSRTLNWKTLLFFIVPIVLLLGVIALFWFTDGAGLKVQPVVPIEHLTFDPTVLRPGEIELHVQNTSPQEVTIAQININDAIWPFTASPDNTIPRLGRAVLTLKYPWVQGESYEINLFSSNSIAF